MSLAYAAYAAAAQRKAKLGWNEWQRAAGGKGYSKEQISTMYKAANAAERFLLRGGRDGRGGSCLKE